MKEQDTFDELLHRYRGLLFTLCSRYKHRGLEVSDLIQEATIAGSEVDSKARVKSTSDLNNTDWTAAITFVLPLYVDGDTNAVNIPRGLQPRRIKQTKQTIDSRPAARRA